MKKAMSAWLCAAAVSGAQADGPKAPTQCSDKQTQTVSAVHGLIGCQDIRAIEVPMIFAQSSPPYTSQVSRGGSVNTHTNASPFTGSITPLHSSQFGNGAIATGILGTTDRAGGLRIETTPGSRRLTADASTAITRGTVASLTAALASENAGKALNNSSYGDASLQAYRFTLGVQSNTFPGVKSAGLALSHGGARDTDLANSTTQSTQTRIVTTPGATQTWQDTYAATTTTRFVGGVQDGILAHAKWDVGSRGEVDMRVGQTHDSQKGNTTVGGIAYAHYMGQSGTLRASYDRLAPGVDQASLSYRMPITPELAFAAGLSHTASTVADTRVSLGLIWTPGAKASSHTRPLGQSLSAKAITQANLDNPYYTPIGIASLGQVVTAVSAQSLVSSTLLSSVAVLPTLPATLPDISIGDNGGGSPVVFTINMPVLKDLNGNQISYNVAGLPVTDINGPIIWSKSQTGAIITISGIYSGAGILNTVHSYILSITSPQANGSTSSNLNIQTN